jgi:hypothetical protein
MLSPAGTSGTSEISETFILPNHSIEEAGHDEGATPHVAEGLAPISMISSPPAIISL